MAAEGWICLWGWGRRCLGRPGLPGPGPGPTTPLFLLLLLGSVTADITDGNSEHLKREHSLIKPYQGVGSSSMPLWDFQGSTMLTSQYVRLTPDERSKEGSIWNHQPCFLKDWEMHVHFKVHGTGKKNLHGDGIALWYTRDRLMPGGPVLARVAPVGPQAGGGHGHGCWPPREVAWGCLWLVGLSVSSPVRKVLLPWIKSCASGRSLALEGRLLRERAAGSCSSALHPRWPGVTIQNSHCCKKAKT